MTEDLPLEAALLAERFGRYLAWADGDRARALELYALNIRLSEALYPPLQMLEVVLRNRIHAILSGAFQPVGFGETVSLLSRTRQPKWPPP